jgi:hypothetical protein
MQNEDTAFFLKKLKNFKRVTTVLPSIESFFSWDLCDNTCCKPMMLTLTRMEW